MWFVLNDFSLVLATISSSLAQYLGLAKDGDAEMLDVMGSGDAAENEVDEQVAADTTPDTTTKTTSGPQAPVFRKGKKVVDDWDVGEDDLVAQEAYLKNEEAAGVGLNDDEEYDKLMNVYRAFRKLKTEFDGKFREIWA